ncbi:MAG: hypothetical protein LBS96_09235 [Oscillospiraceae bacterium]|jgi:hypothetical protein|nr:hypothetical protein [Oscillospiraceae bacterium]
MMQTEVAPAPLQEPITPSLVPPQRKPKKPPRQRNKKDLKLLFMQAVIGIILAAFMILFPFFEKVVILKTTGAKNFLFGDFSLFHVMESLAFGNGRYSPSVLSVVMGITVLIFIFAASFFWLLWAIAAIARKGQNGIRRISIILTFLALGAAGALPHLAYVFVSQFRFIYARAGGVLPEDLQGVTAPLSYVWAGIILLLIVATWVLVFKQKAKKGTVNDNEK